MNGSKANKWQSRAFRISLILCVLSLVSILSWTAWHLYDRNQIENWAKNIAEEKATSAAEQIENTISKALIAQTIADELTSGTLTDDQVEQRLIQELANNPELSAFTVAYASEFVPPGRGRLYAPFSYRNEKGEIVIYRTEESYDYTLPDGSIGPDGNPIRTVWYHRPLEEGPTWGEPYFGTGTQVWWGGFGTPFYRVNPATGQQVVAGIVDASLDLTDFQNLVASVDLGTIGAGYGFIVSQSGNFLSHPIGEFVIEERNILDFDESLNIESLREYARWVEPGKTMVADHVDEETVRPSWVFLSPIPSAGWWVGVVLDKDNTTRSHFLTGYVQTQQAGIAMSSLAFLFFLSVILSHAYKGASIRLWAASISFIILCIVGIGYLWVTNVSTPSAEDPREVVLIDRAITEKVTADYGRGITDPIFVPTGVFLQSMDWTTAHEVIFTGYIWQKYSDNMPDWVRPSPGEAGFILPEETSVWRSVTEVYRQKEGDHEVIGWRVRAPLRQEFDYSQYPFYRETVQIRMWHKNFDQGVILTPDLASYETTAPHELAGLDEEFFVEGWNVDGIFFTYRQSSYKTDFGMPSYLGQKELPELIFNVSLTKQFVDAFISHIIPLSVVAILLFAVLMIGTRSDERIKLIGFSTAAVLAYCAALFFVVILSHINMRTGLEAPERIVYLEYLYFLVYGAILAVSVNSILFASRTNIWLIQYKDNEIIKILFWPVYLWALLIVTLLVFM